MEIVNRIEREEENAKEYIDMLTKAGWLPRAISQSSGHRHGFFFFSSTSVRCQGEYIRVSLLACTFLEVGRPR